MPTSSDKIAIFLPLLVGGGAERVMINLARGLTEKGRNVDLVLGRAEGPYLSQVPEKARLVDLNASRVLTSLPGLVRYLRQNRSAVLISALDHANIVAIWASSLAGVGTKTVLTLHNTLSEKMKKTPTIFPNGLFPSLMRRFYPWADEIVAVSHGVADDYARTTGLHNKRFRVIYNPVISPELYFKASEPLDHPWFAPEAPPVVLAVGRFTEQKDFPSLLRAFASVRKQKPARLMILGEGELRTSMEALITDLRLNDEVALPGFVDNPYKYMAKAALFVLSSRWEGLPTVLIEALAVGTPVVSTNCRSGPAEILNNGQFGTLTPQGDVQALADAIITSLHRGKTEVGREAWQRFEFDWAVDAYLQVIEANNGK